MTFSIKYQKNGFGFQQTQACCQSLRLRQSSVNIQSQSLITVEFRQVFIVESLIIGENLRPADAWQAGMLALQS